MNSENEFIRWLWAYNQQLILFDNHDAFWIKMASKCWEGDIGKYEFNKFLSVYSLRRGKAGHFLSDEKKRTDLIKICNEEYAPPLGNDPLREAQSRWNKVKELLSVRDQISLPSATMKIFWFYHPEKLPMFDQYVRKSLSKRIGSSVSHNDYLIKFSEYYTSDIIEKIHKAVKHFKRKYISYPRIVDKYLWLSGAPNEKKLIERFICSQNYYKSKESFKSPLTPDQPDVE